MEKDIQEGKIVEDARTGEIIPIGEIPTKSGGVEQKTLIDMKQFGILELDAKAEEVLGEPLDPAQVKIRPDGLVYLPWTWYADRLNRAFGRLKWALIPQGAPSSKDVGYNNILVVWGNWFVIKGVPIGFAYGETTYKANNNTMSYGDACEGAKSISLARNCKVLGMALELWDAEWVANWKKNYAETYKGDNDKTYWRKKSGKPAPVKAAKEPAVKKVKENPHGDPSVLETELDVDKEFGGAVQEAIEIASGKESKLKPSDILKQSKLIKEIAVAAGKKDSETAIFIGKLNKSTEYAISEIVARLLEGEK